jgi:hypothetical protein
MVTDCQELWHVYRHFTQEGLKIRMNDVNIKQRTGSHYIYMCMLMHVCERERVNE